MIEDDDRIRGMFHHPFMDASVRAEDLKQNEYKLPNGQVIAKIPKIKGRITRKSPTDRNETYIELIIGEYTKNGKHRNTKVNIGTDLGSIAPGRMLINNNTYYTYFDHEGNLKKDPLEEQRAYKARLKARQEAEDRKKAEADRQQRETEKAEKQQRKAAQKQSKEPQAKPETEQTEERTVDEIREALLQKEKELDRQRQEMKAKKQEAERLMQQLQDAKEELDNLIEIRKYEIQERNKHYLSMMENILESYRDTVKEQAKRRPDTFMSATQIRLINELLRELQQWFSGTEAEDYLHLAEEPQEDDTENHPGTTYGEMAILLSSYNSVLDSCRYGELYWKESPESTIEEPTENEEETEDEEYGETEDE